MAITSGAGTGIIVTSSAVNETIPAQTNVADTTIEVEVSDDITTLSNGNLEATPSYIGRLIILRQGLSNEETRFIVDANASGVGNTWIIQVSEPWTVDPVGNTDTIHVSYIIQDSATLTGLGLVNKTVQDYNSSRRFTIGSGGGTFAFMAFLNGVGLQMDDNGSTTVASFTVENGGRFDCGYLQEGTPTGGAYLQGANGSNGELAFEVIDGGEWNCYATYITGVQRELADFNIGTNSKIRFNGVRWSFIINDVILGAQDTDLNNIAFLSDDTGTTPRIRVRDWATGNEVKNIVCNGFNGFESATSGDDPVLTNTQFISMSKLLTVATGEIWTLVNPIWSPATANQNDISIAGTGEVLEQFSLDTISQEIDGTSTTAKIYIVTAEDRAVSTDGLKYELTADANGLASANIEKRRFTNNAGTSLTVQTSNTFGVISTQYGQLPIIQSVVPSNEDPTSQSKVFGKSLTFTHLPDTFQVETTQATAISNGSGISFEIQATNPASIIKYTGGSGTLTVGATVTGDTSGADGVVLEIMEGDSTSGTVLLDTRDALNFTNDEGLTETGGGGDWTGTYTANSQKDFTNLINANGQNSQTVYDWINAKADEATLDVAGTDSMDDIFFWANQGTYILPVIGDSLGSPNKFKTVRNITTTSGWAVYNTTLGSWTEFVADDGSTFIPQSTVTVNTTVTSSETQNTVQNVKVAYYATPKNTGDQPISSGVTNSSGIYSDSLTLSLPYDMTITARLRGLAPFTVLVTIGTGVSTFDITAPLGTDSSVDRRE